MIKILRVIPVLFLFLFGLNSVRASHISGGNFTYECIGQDSFLITLNLFRDCQGISMNTAASVSFTSSCGGGTTATLTLQSSSEVSQLCPSQLSNSKCNGGFLPGMQHYIYSGIVVLSPHCNSWKMSWNDCCRNLAITNLAGANLNMYIWASMNTVNDSCNSSPAFTASPIPYVCLNQVVNYNFGVVEPDGDSLVYSMSPVYLTATTNPAYVTGYSVAQPLPGSNLVLNPTNGQLTFTPTTLGFFVVCVKVEEYDPSTGLLLGTIIRDIQVVVINCTNNQPLISAPGIYNFTGGGALIDSSTIEVCMGDSFSFSVAFNDPDTADSVTLFSNIYQALDTNAVITVTNGNPSVINVSWQVPIGAPSLISFVITGVDDACPLSGIVSGVFNIIVTPRTSATPDDTICLGAQWSNMGVVGGNQFVWSVISGSAIDTVSTSSGFNMTCTHCDNPSVSPQVTTTYLVISNLFGTCANMDTVTIVVVPNFDLIMPPDTLICSIDSVPLPVNTTQPSFSYTYQWTPSGSLNFDTISNPVALPAVNTTYQVTVESAGGCIKTGQVNVDLSPPFPSNITIVGDTVLCLGESTPLVVDLGDLAPTSCALSATACSGPIFTGDIGTGTATNTGTGYPAPYGNYYWGGRTQILFTAAELQAMGMVNGGKISSIALDVSTVGSTNSFSGFEVKMGCTSSSNMLSGWETGLVTVIPATTYFVTTGWNTHQLPVPYDWDGVSNLVVQFCFNNTGYVFNGNSQTKYTPTTTQMVRYHYADNSNNCTSTINSYTSFNRPNMKFEFCTPQDTNAFNFVWTPNYNISDTSVSSPMVDPLTTTTYTVYVSDTVGGCVDTISHEVQVVTQYNAGFVFNDPFCFDANPETGQPYVAGGIWTGTGIIDSVNGVFSPVAVGIGVWPITYTVSSPLGGCLSDSTMNVVVIPPPDATISPFEICIGSSPDTLTAATPGGTWSGVGIVDSLNGIYDPSSLSAGSYAVIYTLYQPCFSSDTIYVNVIEPYSFTFVNNPILVCENDTVNLDSNYTLSASSGQGSGPVLAIWSDTIGAIDSSGLFNASGLAPGNYTVTLSVSGLNGGCGTSADMIVTVTAITRPSFPNDLMYCDNENNAIISAIPGLFGNGISYTVTPLPPLSLTDTLVINPLGSNGKFDASNSPIGSWEITVSYTNLNGCTGITIDTIHVLETPDIPSIDEIMYCEGDDIYLEGNGSNPDSMYWFNDINLLDEIGMGSPVYWGTAPDPANGDVFVWVTQNNRECISPSVKYQLPIKPTPSAEFEMSYTDTNRQKLTNVPYWQSPIYGYTPFEVVFTANNALPSDSVWWNHHYEEGLNSAWINDGNYSTVGFTYAVSNRNQDGPLGDPFITQCIITNEFGCSDTAQSFIWSVGMEKIYNILTPNNDGVNDVFYVSVTFLKTYHVEIFNRWGDKIYEWDDATQGWDGGNQPDGVYFWVLLGTTIDDLEYNKKGTVTLTGSGR